ncbi:amino acid ABC transporter substrate-binding protein [Paralcaligenes sp. KSB-10]|uniref:amino acid ABC transporter substrate-binding protein n=1 Tax=Paralcaligenes sp. KSB-10 TaxID=2901142 RepID=UPI001E317368|nr:amino acid ABC transporter substrate-binding protein [Paralcaligenes sp. KSB-10]UHL64269.1 amino acid ABC transporter substrate-binding protein [Paralcaligenes sp. KSB-10]
MAGYGKTANAAESSPIKIGAAVSDTGKFAIEGHSTKHGYEMWADEVNARGGIDVAGTKRKVQIIYYDDQSEPETAIKLIQRLISEDKVDFLFGPYSSGLTIATSAIAAKYKKIMFAGAAAANSVFDHKNKYVFSPLSLTSSYTTSGLDALKAKGVKTIAVMHSDDAPMTDIKNATVKQAEAMGIKVVSVQTVPADATDITGAMRQMQAKHPDAFVEAGTTLMGLLATRTMRDIGWAPTYVLMIQAPTEATFVKQLGAATAQGIMAPTQWVPTENLKDKYFGTAKDYFNAYVKKYGSNPSYLPAGASAAGLSLQLAIEKAGSIDTEKVRQALIGLKANTFYGPISYTAPGDPSGLTGANIHRKMLTIQLDEKGNQIVVAPLDIAEAPIQPLKPWNAR